MKLTQLKTNLVRSFLAIGVLIGASGTLFAQPVAAENKCGSVKTAFISCQTTQKEEEEGGAVFEILKLIIKIMAVGVGIVAVGGLAYAGVLYAAAQDNAGQIQQAKSIITNVIIGIVVFALMSVFLNFIIPGGIIG